MANDGSGHVDLSMEGGEPIRPRPEDIQNMNAQFDEKVAAEVKRQTARIPGAERDTAVAAATEQGARGAVLSTLDGMIAGNAGDDLDCQQVPRENPRPQVRADERRQAAGRGTRRRGCPTE